MMNKSSIMTIITLVVSLTFILKVISYHFELSLGPVNIFSVEAWVAVTLFAVIILSTLVYCYRKQCYGHSYMQ
jgi:uncharacterized membrane protein (DUF485 family)